MPPSTELTVHIVAYVQALILFARTIGIKIMSGGIGKKELSENDIIARNQGALGSLDFSSVQS